MINRRGFRREADSTVIHGLKRSRGAYGGPVSDWNGRQVWVGLPDRLLGLVSTVPGVDNAKGYAVQGVLRLISGGTTGARVLKELETISPTHYRYGQLDIIIHENTYTSVSGITVPYRVASLPATELTFSDRSAEPAGPGTERTYPANTDYRFVVEIRPTWADPAKLTSVTALGDQELLGLEIVSSAQSFQVWLNAGDNNRVASIMRDRLPAGQDSLAVSDGLLGKPVFQTNVPLQADLASGQHAVLVVSNNPEDHDNGWNSFSDMVGYPDIQLQGERSFDLVAPNATKEQTFTIVNNNETPLILTGTPTLQFEGDPVFSVTQDVAQSTLANGESTSFKLRFAPTAPGDYAATLKIATNNPTDEYYEAPLTGVGSNEIVQIQTSPFGTSWENPAIWANGMAATSGGHYLVRRSYELNAGLRTPATFDAVFPGEQLSFIDGGFMFLKLGDGGTITVERTVFNGGGLVFASGPLSYTWVGEVQVKENGMFAGGGGAITFTGPVTGDGPIDITSHMLFSNGDWGGDLTINGDNAIARFEFDITEGKSLTYTSGTFDINGRNHKFENLFFDRTPMPPGVYSAQDLGDGFVGDGSITIEPYQRP